MDNVVYKVVFEGDILPGFGQLEVQKKLAKLFGVDVKIAARLFMDSYIEVKRDLTLAEAKKHMRSLAKIGAITYLVPYEINEDTVPNLELHNSLSLPATPGLSQTDAFTSYFENKEKELEEREVEAPHDLAVQDITEPENNTTEPRNKSFLGSNTAPGTNSTPEDHVEVTDIDRIRDMQRIARQMLTQKRPFD